jgi:heme-degrading monooxygenase HmoA
MIARIWSAQTTPALSDAYLHHFDQTVQPQLQHLAGFLGVTVCIRPVPSAVEIVVTTYWKSLAAIDTFAGADREAAVVTAEAAELLTDFDKRVRHYEVAFADFPQITAG